MDRLGFQGKFDDRNRERRPCQKHVSSKTSFATRCHPEADILTLHVRREHGFARISKGKLAPGFLDRLLFSKTRTEKVARQRRTSLVGLL